MSKEGWRIVIKINYKKLFKNFWFGTRTESLMVSEMALNILLLFETTCVCEVVFLAQLQIKVSVVSEKHRLCSMSCNSKQSAKV